MGYQLQVKTSFVSPVTLKIFTENGYLPIFIIRNISNSELIGKYNGTAVHFRNLAQVQNYLEQRETGLLILQNFLRDILLRCRM